jgi:threonine/homoserine/homoserine lactone efflux protein
MTTYLAFVVFLFFWNLSPGPIVTLISRNSVKYSYKGGFSTILGVVLVDCLYLTLAMLGVSEFIAKHEKFFYYAKMVGAVYIFYIGASIFYYAKQDKGYTNTETSEKEGFNWKKLTGIGILTDLSNPLTILGMTSFILQFFKTGMPFAEKALYAISVPVLSIACFAIVTFLFGNPLTRKLILPKMVWFERIAGLLLAWMAIMVLFFNA